MIDESPSDLLRRRFGGARAGLDLVGIASAALPVTQVKLDVLAQERKELPLLDEFVLRFVFEGIDDIEEITDLLGLKRDQVLGAVAARISDGNFRRTGEGSLALTPLGLEVARNLAAVQPVITQISAVFDRITWSIEDYSKLSLLTKRDAEDQGLLLLPALKSARINAEDVPVERFNEFLTAQHARPKAQTLEVLRVRRIASQNLHRFLPAILLVYGDSSTGEVDLGLCVEGELRPAHGLQLSAIGAVERLGISVGRSDDRPQVDPQLEAMRLPISEVDEARRVDPSEPARGSAAPDSGAGEDTSGTIVRAVSVFEHPDLLERALTTARTRLLLMSPWVKNAVVNTDFIAKLERRLRAGVVVHLGHGMGEDDRGSDELALRKLGHLADRFPDRFHLVRLQSSHAKILIFDDNWITTSFNWLSFRGDPNRTFRMEEGTLVQIPQEVDKKYQRYVRIILGGGAP